MRAVVVFGFVWCVCALPACGGLQSERADPHPRESDELHAREWHDRVVRLEGETSEAAAAGDDCGAVCQLATRACELTDRDGAGAARAGELGQRADRVRRLGRDREHVSMLTRGPAT